jgi:hypothetical protein
LRARSIVAWIRATSSLVADFFGLLGLAAGVAVVALAFPS